MKSILSVLTLSTALAQAQAPSAPASAGAAAGAAASPTPPGAPANPTSPATPGTPGATTPRPGTPPAGLNRNTSVPTAPGRPFTPLTRSTGTGTGAPGFAFGGLTNVFSDITFTNRLGTNISVNDLAALLLTLQQTVEVVLPALDGFNDSFSFVNLPASGTTTSTGPRNVGIRLPLGTNAAANLRARSLNPNVPTPTGVNNPFGLAPGFGGPGQTNGALAVRDSFRALIVLQTDLERLLPILSALNGGIELGSGGLQPGAGATAGSGLTNRFSPPSGGSDPAGLVPTGGGLTPTGRP